METINLKIWLRPIEGYYILITNPNDVVEGDIEQVFPLGILVTPS